ncbi:MAG: histidine ammonia-lyase, partial [Candidatus Marinimicrobia bacterium]|nr:histidine ammonia-lyase [Candidatus Neomarinimicrobiota bacterium]
MEGCIISNKSFTWRDLEHLIESPKPLRLSNLSKKAIKKSNQSLLKILRSDRVIYGVNTGFGKLSSVPIESKDLKKLQLNLVRSHAAGTGKPFDSGITRLTMALKILTWSKGYSGVRPKLVTLLLKMINHDILPVIPRQGSVGASGDLAPLSHVACSMIGEGMVYFNNRRISSMTAFKKAKITPIALEAKEGLSLINGTQLSTAIAIKALSEASKVLLTADIISAVSVEASLSTRKVFKPAIHRLKKHKGQLVSAKNIYSLLDKSQIVESHKDCNKIQDPYCVRCIPHVHGASWEMFSNSEKIINNEINSVSDNPLIFPNGDVLSSGHFHAEPVAQALDALSIAMSEIGAISERRIHYFMKGA